MRKSTMKKVLDNSSSGARGGKQLTEVDEAVLDILDRKTVYIRGKCYKNIYNCKLQMFAIS
jgi:hypothetical protein